MQNGNLKHKIQGADTPLLSSQVLQLTPMTADSDDLAVRCICQLCCLPNQCCFLCLANKLELAM